MCTHSIQSAYTRPKICRAHMPFTHSCAFYTHTDTPDRMYALKSHIHTRHTRACMHDIRCPSVHTPFTYSCALLNQWDLQGVWGEDTSKEWSPGSRKLQSPASPPGAAAPSADPAQGLQLRPSQFSGGDRQRAEKTAPTPCNVWDDFLLQEGRRGLLNSRRSLSGGK